MEPGDVLRLRCTYKTTNRDMTIYYGDSTQDEMCYSFVTYYPFSRNFTTCVSLNNLALCNKKPLKAQMGECDLAAFLTSAASKTMVADVLGHCDSAGISCSSDCSDTFRKYEEQHACMRGDKALLYIIQLQRSTRASQNGDKFRNAYHSCKTLNQASDTARIVSSEIFTIVSLTSLLFIYHLF